MIRYVFICFAILSMPAGAVAFEPHFNTGMTYPTGNHSQGAFAADLDGNGSVDLAMCGMYRLAILLNMGERTYSNPVSYEIDEHRMSYICGADFDADNDIDLAATIYDNSLIAIFINNGDGTFQPRQDYPVGSQPSCVFSADLDGDLDIDIVAANGGADNISVLLNSSSGIFQGAVNYAVGDEPREVSGGDFDGDGDIDLATANYASGDVSMMRNNGNGTFAAAVNYSIGSGSGPSAVCAAALSPDGEIDLLVTGENNNTLFYLVNDGGGVFHIAGTYEVGAEPASVCAADLDGDVDIDLAVLNRGDKKITILKNTGYGSLQPAGEFFAGSQPKMVYAADVDGDSDADLILPDWSARGAIVMENDGEGGFPQPLSFISGNMGGAYGLEAADLDGDGDPDLAAAGGYQSISVLINNGSAFQEPVSYTLGGNPMDVAAADFDGDFDIDLAVPNLANRVSVMMNNGNGTFQAAVDYPAPDDPWAIYSADLDGDGDFDLAVADEGNLVLIFLNNGDGTFYRGADCPVGSSTRDISGADFDSDGDMDLAVTNYSSNTFSILINNGNGTFAPQVGYYIGPGSGPMCVCPSDIDADGDFDLAIAAQSNFYIAIFRNNGPGTFTHTEDYSLNFGAYPYDIISCDLDGDSDQDLAAACDQGGNVCVLDNNGDGTFSITGRYIAGAESRSLVAVDLNNDPYMDLAVDDSDWDTDRARISILLNRGSANAERGAIVGVVTEPDGITPIPGAQILVRRDGWSAGSDITDPQGSYSIPGLLIGPYQIEASRAGYETAINDSIQVALDETTFVNIVMASSGGCDYMAGDINGNGSANGIDVVYGVSYLKGGNAPPTDCNPPCTGQPDPFFAAMDVNGNCAANGIDITFFVAYLKGLQPALLNCPNCPPAGAAASSKIGVIRPALRPHDRNLILDSRGPGR